MALSVPDAVFVKVSCGPAAQCLVGHLHDAGTVLRVYALNPPFGIGGDVVQLEAQDVFHPPEVLYPPRCQVIVIEEAGQSLGR
jgi:hypothetical protein